MLAVVGALIGAVSLSGSVIAWAKLDGRMDKRYTFPGQQWFNAAGRAGGGGAAAAWRVHDAGRCRGSSPSSSLALALGVLMTLPIGGADMPVVISLYNALTGLAVAFEGYVLGNEALIIAGMMVGAAGMLLTRLMAKAMNRPISGVLFSNFGGGSGEMQEIAGAQKPIEAGDVAAMMAYAERVVIVPGYGMAVAQAQHKIWELTQQLMERGVKVKFAIHPVAGRMPGHMNVLLAEAGVPYDLIADMDDINPEFANTDVSLVIGANDVVNPVAKTDPASPIYGMPILDVVNSQEHHRHQARQGHRLRRHRERAVLRRQHPHAVRRRRRDGQRAGQRTEGAGRRPLSARVAAPCSGHAQRATSAGARSHGARPPRAPGQRHRCQSAELVSAQRPGQCRPSRSADSHGSRPSATPIWVAAMPPVGQHARPARSPARAKQRAPPPGRMPARRSTSATSSAATSAIQLHWRAGTAASSTQTRRDAEATPAAASDASGQRRAAARELARAWTVTAQCGRRSIAAAGG